MCACVCVVAPTHSPCVKCLLLKRSTAPPTPLMPLASSTSHSSPSPPAGDRGGEGGQQAGLCAAHRYLSTPQHTSAHVSADAYAPCNSWWWRYASASTHHATASGVVCRRDKERAVLTCSTHTAYAIGRTVDPAVGYKGSAVSRQKHCALRGGHTCCCGSLEAEGVPPAADVEAGRRQGHDWAGQLHPVGQVGVVCKGG